jgi:hypothetical protein
MRRHHDRNWSGPALIFAASDVKRLRIVGTGDVAIRKPKRRTVFALFSVAPFSSRQLGSGLRLEPQAEVRIHFTKNRQESPSTSTTACSPG